MNRPHPWKSRRDQEDGVSLIFALIFIVVAALVLGALVTAAGDDIVNSTNIKGQTSLEYAADGAGTLAVQSVRYSGKPYSPTTPTDCLPGGGTVQINSEYIVVDCTQQQFNPGSGLTRQIDFNAYRCATAALSSCATTALLEAQVTFDDYADDNKYHCSPGTSLATCGSGMTVNSWTIETANH